MSQKGTALAGGHGSALVSFEDKKSTLGMREPALALPKGIGFGLGLVLSLIHI